MDIINNYLRTHITNYDSMSHKAWKTELLRCKDGFAVSVQASEYHYCEPRASEAWPYSKFELGYPTGPDPEETVKRIIGEYAEDDDLYHTVYICVPLEKVIELINAHGGIDD